MKKYIAVIFATSLLFVMNNNNILAEDLNEEVEREDVTGDGKVDTISVKESIVTENNHTVIKEILQLDIAGNKTMTIPLSAGHPWLLLTDLNNDGVKDVFVSIRSGGGKEEVKSYGYTFKNNKKQDVSVPPFVEINGQLLNDYKAKLKVINRVYMLDLKASKRALEQMEIYKNGQLQNSDELIISEYLQLKPIITTSGKGMRGVQRVQGAIPNKSLGEIISVWYFRDGKWMLHDIEYNSNYKKLYQYLETDE